MSPTGVRPVRTFMLWYLSESRTLSTSSHTPRSSSSCGRDKAKPSLTTEQSRDGATDLPIPPSAHGSVASEVRDLKTEIVPQSVWLPLSGKSQYM